MNTKGSLIIFLDLVLTCCALSPQARAVCQEGCLTNDNTVLGNDALASDTTGQRNTAIGSAALFSNTTAFNNTATGFQALQLNTTGTNNTATGNAALEINTSGIENTATGASALASNMIGDQNTANGVNALAYNTTGDRNTAIGSLVLYRNNGKSNIALGSRAGYKLTTGDNNIDIAASGVAGESNTIRIGVTATHQATYIAGISGVTVAGGVGVIIDTNGHLGTIVSSERYKDNIQPMDNASEAILSLEPVSFRYKKALDPKGIPQFGLVAEQVEKINPDLVARDDEGKPYTVRYEAVNAMLLNEFLKEHRKVEELQKFVVKQQAINSEQQKQIAALIAQMQQVSEQLRANKLPPQLIVDN